MITSGCLFLGLAAGGLREGAAWTVAAALLWTTALIWPPTWSAVPSGALWGAWLIWTGMSAALSAEPLRSLAAFTHTATFVLFFAMAYSHWREAERRGWFFLLCIAGAALGLAALFLKSPGYIMVGWLRPYYNYTACVQAAVFMACLGALGENRPKAANAKGLLLGLMAFSLLVLICAKSRGGLLACALASALWMWRKGQGRLLAGLLAAALAAFAMLPSRYLAPMLKLDTASSYLRPKIWAAAIHIANEHPFFGEGPGQFERGFLRHNFPAPPTWPTRYGLATAHAHSEFLQTAAETGWPGLALFLWALGASAGAFKKSSWTRAAALNAFTAIFIQTGVDNLLTLPALGFFYFSALAVATEPAASDEAVGATGRQKALYAVGLLLACAAWWPDWALQRFRQRAYGSQGAEALRWIGKSLWLAPHDSMLWEDLSRLRLRESPPDVDGALAALRQAEELSPTNALYPLMRAEILRARGRWAEISALAESALRLEPQCLEARLLLGEALYRMGRKKEALRQIQGIEERGISSASTQPLHSYAAFILHFDAAHYREVSRLIRK